MLCPGASLRLDSIGVEAFAVGGTNTHSGFQDGSTHIEENGVDRRVIFVSNGPSLLQ